MIILFIVRLVPYFEIWFVIVYFNPVASFLSQIELKGLVGEPDINRFCTTEKIDIIFFDAIFGITLLKQVRFLCGSHHQYRRSSCITTVFLFFRYLFPK